MGNSSFGWLKGLAIIFWQKKNISGYNAVFSKDWEGCIKLFKIWGCVKLCEQVANFFLMYKLRIAYINCNRTTSLEKKERIIALWQSGVKQIQTVEVVELSTPQTVSNIVRKWTEQLARAGCHLLRSNCQWKYKCCSERLEGCHQKNIRFYCQT